MELHRRQNLIPKTKITTEKKLYEMAFGKITDTENEELTKEYEIIKYALTYLLSNIDDDVIEDLSDYIGKTNYEEVEKILTDIIESY
jgi:hypothetical protein